MLSNNSICHNIGGPQKVLSDHVTRSGACAFRKSVPFICRMLSSRSMSQASIRAHVPSLLLGPVDMMSRLHMTSLSWTFVSVGYWKRLTLIIAIIIRPYYYTTFMPRLHVRGSAYRLHVQEPSYLTNLSYPIHLSYICPWMHVPQAFLKHILSHFPHWSLVLGHLIGIVSFGPVVPNYRKCFAQNMSMSWDVSY